MGRKSQRVQKDRVATNTASSYKHRECAQAEWAENPLDKELELKEFRASVLGDDELIARLKQEIKKVRDENQKQAEEIMKLRGLKLTSADAKRANQLRRSEKRQKSTERNSQMKEGMVLATNPIIRK